VIVEYKVVCQQWFVSRRNLVGC